MSGIRVADIPDMAAICDMGRELLAGSVYADIKPDEQKFKMTIAGLMGHRKGLVLVVVDDDNQPQGFLAAITDEYGFSKACFATDLWTYVRPGYRRYAYRLYGKLIAWAKTKPKVAFIELAQSSGMGDHSRWCKLMEKLGLTRVGSLYMMRVEKCPA